MICLIGGCAPLDKKINADNVYGRAGRLAKDGYDRTLGPMEGQDEFDKIKTLFDEAAAAQQAAKTENKGPSPVAAEKYAQSQRLLEKFRKKYKDKPIEEDAMFYLGECYYEQGYYPAAQDMYDELLDKYTSSRYVEPITRRLFYIAQTWLNQPKPADEIERVEFVSEKGEPAVKKEPLTPYAATLMPNFTDRSRPLFDPEGRALQALKSIWLKDPTGPLADDSLMLSATHHMRRHNFKEADDLFNILRSEYPNSEHSQNSYLLGSHVKLLTYQGSSYDGKQLDEASKLIDSTLRLYPDLPEKDRLQKKLDSTKEAAAARDWDRVEFYLRKGAKHSAELYCEFLLRDHPHSEYAVRAAEMLKRLRPQKTVAKKTVFESDLEEDPLDDLEEDGAVTVETGWPQGLDVTEPDSSSGFEP